MKLFDYFFYRVARAYYKSDGHHASTAVVGVSALQFLLASALLMPCMNLIKATHVAPKVWGVAGIGFGLAILFYNYNRYQGQYAALNDLWGQESPAQRRWKGVLVVLATPLAFALLIVVLWLIQFI